MHAASWLLRNVLGCWVFLNQAHWPSPTDWSCFWVQKLYRVCFVLFFSLVDRPSGHNHGAGSNHSYRTVSIGNQQTYRREKMGITSFKSSIDWCSKRRKDRRGKKCEIIPSPSVFSTFSLNPNKWKMTHNQWTAILMVQMKARLKDPKIYEKSKSQIGQKRKETHIPDANR